MMTCDFPSILAMSEPHIWLGWHTTTLCSSHVGGACCTCLHVSQQPIRLVMSLSIPGQYTVDLALALHLEIPKWPVWRHLRYSSCSDFGITILVAFMMSPSTMLKFHECMKVWVNLSTLVWPSSLAGFAFDLINLSFLKYTDCSNGDIYGLIFQCRFSLYITT